MIDQLLGLSQLILAHDSHVQLFIHWFSMIGIRYTSSSSWVANLFYKAICYNLWIGSVVFLCFWI